jgi:endoglucanase
MKSLHTIRTMHNYPRIFPFFLVAAALLTATTVSAAPISVNTQSVKFSSGQYKLRNACNGKLVDVESIPSPWSRVQQRSDGARVGQAWEVSDQGDGTYRLTVPGSNSALQTSYGGTAQGTSIDVWSWGNYSSQRWQLLDAGSGNIKLALASAPNMVLDIKYTSSAENADVWLYLDNGGCAQRFNLEPVNTISADAAGVAKALGRGVNLQGLDGPREGDWGPLLEDDFFNRAQEAGLRTLRLPIRWSNNAQATAPYTINEAFFKRVDYAISATLARGMRAVINMHNYHQLDNDPLDNFEFAVADNILEERFVAMWKQIAARYANQAETVLFELYNEPHNRLTAQKWNTLLQQALSEVRKTNPNRYVVIGPVGYNNASELANLVIPANDQRLIVTVHNYDPFQFTHQGTTWNKGSAAWLGTKCCSPEQIAEITKPMDIAYAWSKQNRRPIWVGEFGSYEKADLASRVQYTRIARDTFEQRGWSWALWDFNGIFGIYDPKTKQWRTELRDALIK